MDQVKFVQDSPYEADHANSNFVKAVFHEFYLIHSWILCPVSPSLYQINDQWNILMIGPDVLVMNMLSQWFLTGL